MQLVTMVSGHSLVLTIDVWALGTRWNLSHLEVSWRVWDDPLGEFPDYTSKHDMHELSSEKVPIQLAVSTWYGWVDCRANLLTFEERCLPQPSLKYDVATGVSLDFCQNWATTPVSQSVRHSDRALLLPSLYNLLSWVPSWFEEYKKGNNQISFFSFSFFSFF